jgi:hypothetical protein
MDRRIKTALVVMPAITHTFKHRDCRDQIQEKPLANLQTSPASSNVILGILERHFHAPITVRRRRGWKRDAVLFCRYTVVSRPAESMFTAIPESSASL